MEPQIIISSPELTVRLDPAHGAEIQDIVHKASGRQLLARPSFVPAEPRGGDLDEGDWTAAYRGGWQLAAPNAGSACVVDGVAHGFHGRASVDPWTVEAQSANSCRLSWSGHGLRLERNVYVTGPTVEVQLRWTAVDGRRPLIMAEHLCFGAELLDPCVELRADALAHELSEASGPPQVPSRARRWPAVLRLDGTSADDELGEIRLSRPRARFAALSGWSHGHAELHNPAAGITVTVQWDEALLPYAWLWEEIQASGGIWDHTTELLGFEPASVPHSLGLAEAVRHDQAWWADAGTMDGYRMAVTVGVD